MAPTDGESTAEDVVAQDMETLEVHTVPEHVPGEKTNETSATQEDDAATEGKSESHENDPNATADPTASGQDASRQDEPATNADNEVLDVDDDNLKNLDIDLDSEAGTTPADNSMENTPVDKPTRKASGQAVADNTAVEEKTASVKVETV